MYLAERAVLTTESILSQLSWTASPIKTDELVSTLLKLHYAWLINYRCKLIDSIFHRKFQSEWFAPCGMAFSFHSWRPNAWLPHAGCWWHSDFSSKLQQCLSSNAVFFPLSWPVQCLGVKTPPGSFLLYCLYIDFPFSLRQNGLGYPIDSSLGSLWWFIP